MGDGVGHPLVSFCLLIYFGCTKSVVGIGLFLFSPFYDIRDISWTRRFEYFTPFLDGWVHSFFLIFFLGPLSLFKASFRAFPTTVGGISPFLVLVLFFNQEKGKRRERCVEKKKRKKRLWLSS